MEIFLASIATEEYESMASALIEMGATDTNVDTKAFARDLEKMFSSIKIVVLGGCGRSFWFRKMMGRSPFAKAGGFRPENLGPSALALIGNLCFTFFVLGVLIFTIIAATYELEDPLFHPSTKITTFR